MIFATHAASARCVICAAFVVASYALPEAAFATAVPDYPAAKTQRISNGVRSITSRCGHTFTVEKSLNVDADPRTVAKWYQSRLPGSRAIDESRLGDDEGGGRTTSIQVFTADGSQTVVISRTQYTGGLSASAKMLGMDETDIGVEAVSPPLAPTDLDLTARVAAGGPAGERAKQQMMAACKR